MGELTIFYILHRDYLDKIICFYYLFFISCYLFYLYSGVWFIYILIFFLMHVNSIYFIQRVTYNCGVYWQSFPNLLRYFIPGSNIYVVFVFLRWSVWYTVKFWTKEQEPFYAYVLFLLIYLLF